HRAAGGPWRHRRGSSAKDHRLPPMKKAFAAVLALALCAAAPTKEKSGWDILFTNARVVDGTGAPWFAADVAVSGGKIAAVGKLAPRSAARTVDATRLVPPPGFIDLLRQSGYNLLLHPPAP